MEIKIKITTPKGEAKRTQWRLRPFILGLFVKVKESYVNKENTEIIWVVEGDVRKCVSVASRVGLYENAIKGAFESKPVKWAMKKSSQADQDMVKDMIKNGTKIEVLKVADVKDWEQAQKPYWKRIKELINNKKV